MPGLPLTNCFKCPLYNKQYYNPQNNTGNINAKLAICGEAPGGEEEATGKNFQGDAGKLLRIKGLREIGLSDNEDVFIFNSVLCRPPNNRKPTEEEISFCSENIDHIIKTVKPKVIVALGRIAIKRLTGKGTAIEKIRGNPINNSYGIIIPTYHTGYVLRGNPHAMNWIRDDIKHAADIVGFVVQKNKDSVSTKEVRALAARGSARDYQLIDTLAEFQELYNQLVVSEAFSFDIETTGFLYYKGDRIIGCSFSWERCKAAYIPLLVLKEDLPSFSVNAQKVIVNHWSKKKKKFIELELYPFWGKQQPLVYKYLGEIFESDANKSGHNSTFDVKFIESGTQLSCKVKNWSFDTITAHYLLNENLKHDLKSVSDMRYSDLRGYSIDLKTALTEEEDEEENYADQPLSILAPYGCADADATFRLTQDLSIELRQDPKLNDLMHNMYVPMHHVYKEMEMNGTLVDLDYADCLLELFREELEKKANHIFESAGVEPFNINSTQQLANVLFNVMKIPVIEYTEKGTPSTRAEVLKQLAVDYPLCWSISHYRFFAKMISNHLIGIRSFIDSRGRVHYTYNFRLVTGRLSTKAYSIQTVPRDQRVRALFIAEPGHKFIGADYSQMELRCMAWYAQDQVMLQEFQDKVDIHKRTASQVFNKPQDQITKDERKKGKLLNFGGLYGGSAGALTSHVNEKLDESDVPIDDAISKKFLDYFFSRYTGIERFIKNTIKIAHRDGYVRNCFGRVRRLPGIYSNDRELIAESERQAVNTLIQGSGSDFLQMANIETHAKYDKYNMKTKILFTVHDALYDEAPDDEVEAAKEIITECMLKKRPPAEDIPLDLELQSGNRWKPIPESIRDFLKSKNYQGLYE